MKRKKRRKNKRKSKENQKNDNIFKVENERKITKMRIKNSQEAVKIEGYCCRDVRSAY